MQGNLHAAGVVRQRSTAPGVGGEWREEGQAIGRQGGAVGPAGAAGVDSPLATAHASL